jgi:hypothetical protein
MDALANPTSSLHKHSPSDGKRGVPTLVDYGGGGGGIGRRHSDDGGRSSGSGSGEPYLGERLI